MRILVIEDNPKMAGGIRRGLVEHGYAVDVSHSGYEGEMLAATTPYDVIVLDIMLSDRDGLDVCRSLRRRKVRTPILVLTALSGTREKVAGLDAGADDYLTKPFEFDELVARIRALLRRGQATEAAKLAYADLEVNVTRRSVTRTGVKIDLSNKEFALLEYFVRNPDRVIGRQMIAEKVWDMNYEPSSNVIDVYISSLRRKLDRDFDYPLIHTIIGIGYRFGTGSDGVGA
jgi:two-component system copper resistance phosphate regulon response regulator CusR